MKLFFLPLHFYFHDFWLLGFWDATSKLNSFGLLNILVFNDGVGLTPMQVFSALEIWNTEPCSYLRVGNHASVLLVPFIMQLDGSVLFVI